MNKLKLQKPALRLFLKNGQHLWTLYCFLSGSTVLVANGSVAEIGEPLAEWSSEIMQVASPVADARACLNVDVTLYSYTRKMSVLMVYRSRGNDSKIITKVLLSMAADGKKNEIRNKLELPLKDVSKYQVFSQLLIVSFARSERRAR